MISLVCLFAMFWAMRTAARLMNCIKFCKASVLIKSFELLLVVFGGTVGKCCENVKVYAAEFPCEGYSYMDKKVKFTKAGYHFEEPFVRCCREEVIKLTEKGNA